MNDKIFTTGTGQKGTFLIIAILDISSKVYPKYTK